MSYTIDEAIDEAGQRIEAMKEVHAKYPKATLNSLPDGRQVWTNHTIEPTGIIFSATKKDGTVQVCPYEKIGAIMVFSSEPVLNFADQWMDKIAKQHPELYATLLESF
jgi:hypothetical protein